MIIWLACISFTGQSQVHAESYRFLTDRSIYIAGEEIYFRVINISPEELRELNWSKVYYTELVSPGGISYVQSKLALDSAGTSGSLRIPRNTPSGTYFLKGYTKWMRNFGPAGYSFISLEIVNPYTRAVLPADTVAQYTTRLLPKETENNTSPVDLDNLKEDYEKRAPVRLNLTPDLQEGTVSCCVSVIRSGSMKRQVESDPFSGPGNPDHFNQIPETRGVSITGQVQFVETGLPASYAVVYISVLGEEKTFHTNYADSSGRFYFSLPGMHGEADLFLSANHDDPGELNLLVDQDFCTVPVVLPAFPAVIGQSDYDLIKELSVHAQISERYRTDMPDTSVVQTEESSFFYGQPSVVIQFDDFIKLPTLQEYFTELTPQVALRRSGGEMKFRVLGDHPDLDFYQPLLMIDGVAIFDTDAILDISPRQIEKLEIVDAPYIKGNVTFGGIINIISRNNNMGFVDLPASGLLLNYHMLDEGVTGIKDQAPADPRIPHMRNTLYWNPEITLFQGESRIIEFQTGDVPGRYEVMIS